MSQEDETGKWTVSGNMTDAALKVAAAKGGLWDCAFDEKGPGVELQTLKYPRMNDLEVPFNSSRKMMATFHKLPADRCLETLQFPEGSTHCAILKGAPDRLIPQLKAVLEDDGTNLKAPGAAMSSEERLTLQQQS